MIAILVACLAGSCSILIVAVAWTRIRGFPMSASMPPGLRSAVRFAGGPFSISIAIHLAILFAPIAAVHEPRARELLIVQWEPGAIHPLEGAEPLEIPDIPMPDFNTGSPDDSPQPVDVNKVLSANSSAIAGTSSDTGINLDRRIGNYMNLHPGRGGGGGTF